MAMRWRYTAEHFVNFSTFLNGNVFQFLTKKITFRKNNKNNIISYRIVTVLYIIFAGPN